MSAGAMKNGADLERIAESGHGSGAERRRDQRLKLPYPVEVYGFDRAGQYFTERTVTFNVSSGGCMMDLKHEPETEGVMAVRRLAADGSRHPDRKPVLFRVCWTKPMGRRWLLGLNLLHPVDVWGLHTPEWTDENQRAGAIRAGQSGS